MYYIEGNAIAASSLKVVSKAQDIPVTRHKKDLKTCNVHLRRTELAHKHDDGKKRKEKQSS